VNQISIFAMHEHSPKGVYSKNIKIVANSTQPCHESAYFIK